ncbi:MAG: hypothetical protein ACRC8A_01135 [Microcoleaceae cyanobacterium]
MQVDLEGLEITPGELRHLSGFSPQHFYRPVTRKKLTWEVSKTLIAGGLTFLSYGILSFIFPSYSRLNLLIHLVLGIGLIVDDAYKILTTLTHQNLIHIFEDVDRYNAMVKAVDIYDEIATVGETQPQLNHRLEVLNALRILREDLVRALRTECILRKNRRFLAEHQDLFVTNLNTLAALQISDRATEHGRLLNEALKLATDIQAKVQELQEKQIKH